MNYLKTFLKLGRKEQASIILLGVAGVFLLTALFKLMSPASTPFDSQQIVADLKKSTAPNKEKMKQTIELNRKRAAEIEKQNYFFPMPKPPQPTIMAIMGEEVLINGQWLKIGGQFSGSKIKAIFPDSVVMEEKGKEKTLYVNGFSQESEKSRWVQEDADAPKPKSGNNLVFEINE